MIIVAAKGFLCGSSSSLLAITLLGIDQLMSQSTFVRTLVGTALLLPLVCRDLIAAPPAGSVEFFEQRIRPLLVDHCYECHAVDSDQAGGLSVDSRSSLQLGGESGPAIVPGDAMASKLYRVVANIDPELEMPPDGKLPPRAIDDLRKWIDAGAVDPRDELTAPQARRKADPVDWNAAADHWAYKPPLNVPVPSVGDHNLDRDWPSHPIDHFILTRLQDQGFRPSPEAEPEALLRRLSIDLTGLPPTPHQIRGFLAAADAGAQYEHYVDRWISSPDFSERFARHWLDVVRYAESVTLRGLILTEAWRFRDYVIDSIDRDRSWKDVLLEHVAGDLLTLESLEARRQAQIATTFLCLGNSNLENQQKRELEMDFIDEQLDTIGRALLGQTIGCARCHDHKFDPIPTSDYYALAGILNGSVGIDHANVSRWVEIRLPLTHEEEERESRLSTALVELKAELDSVKKRLRGSTAMDVTSVSSADLPGFVVDQTHAQRVGQWQESSHTKPFVDGSYLHDMNAGRGEKSLTYHPEKLPAGVYEVRISYCAQAGRSSRVPVTVFSAEGEQTILVNQRETPGVDGLWHSLGQFRFEPGGQAFVMISNEGADGHVIGDAVHFRPIDSAASDQLASSKVTDSQSDLAVQRLRESEKRLTRELGDLQKQLDSLPKSMGLRPREKADDLPIHIRGSIHNLGEVAPRGVLRVIGGDQYQFELGEGDCGRLELARWIANDANPLTARVLVNRIWLWVMGQGLVRTADNFGTTGQQPTHPELLDWLTLRFIEDGWSIKRLVKQIVMSSTYRQSSIRPAADDLRMMTDPDNRLWWRADRKPVSAEALRDGVLAISGELDPTRFGSRIRPGTNTDYSYEHDPRTRSVYLPAFRNSVPDLLEAFNYTDPSYVTGQRQRGIVAQQALMVLNHPWFAERAAAAAARNLREAGSSARDRIEFAFLQTLARKPQPDELADTIHFYEECYRESIHPTASTDRIEVASAEALAQVYRILFATAEFRLVD